MVPELFALVDVVDVDLDDRHLGDPQRVGQGDRRVRPGAGVDDDAADLATGLVQPVDHLALAVGLRRAQAETEFGGEALAVADDLGEGRRAVDLGSRNPKVFRLGPLSNNSGNGSFSAMTPA